MTTLTKERREEIIDSVINKGTNLPEKKKELAARVAARVREICLTRVPKDFPAATKNLPAVWFPHLASIGIRREINPLAILQYSEEELQRSRWYDQGVSFEPIKHPFNVRFDRQPLANGNSEKPNDPESWEVLLSPLIDEALALRSTEDKARGQLAAFLASVRTYKQALEKMPELEGHLPRVAGKSFPISAPVGPLVQMLTGLGFDKSVTP